MRESTRAWLVEARKYINQQNHFSNCQPGVPKWELFPWERDGNPNTDEIRKQRWANRLVLYLDFERVEMLKKFPELEQP